MKFFDHKDLGNHLLQLCPKVVKHPLYNFILSLYFKHNGLSSTKKKYIKLRRFESLGHVATMDGERTGKKLLEGKPVGGRKMSDLD